MWAIIDKQWMILSCLFYFVFYAGPVFVLPYFLNADGRIDYVIHTGAVISASSGLEGKQQLPSSSNPHPLMSWPLGYFYDQLIERAFVTVPHGAKSTTQSFLKVQFAIVLCGIFASRISRLIQIRKQAAALQNA